MKKVKRKKYRILPRRAIVVRQRQFLLTGILLTALLLLLFGICSRLPAPELSEQAMGVPSIGYSAFLAQIRAGNVLEVSLKDQDIEGLLDRPPSSDQGTPAPETKMTPLLVRASPAKASPLLDEVGGQRGAFVLRRPACLVTGGISGRPFDPPPLPEPDRQVSPHPALQAYFEIRFDC